MILNPPRVSGYAGVTGIYIQNAYVRIKSILRREKAQLSSIPLTSLNHQKSI